MIGAGVFAAFAPAAAAAGHRTADRTRHRRGRRVLQRDRRRRSSPPRTRPRAARTRTAAPSSAPWWGFIAGWCFVIGKLASCAAMALTFAAYAAPPGWERPVAILAVAALVDGQLLRRHAHGAADPRDRRRRAAVPRRRVAAGARAPDRSRTGGARRRSGRRRRVRHPAVRRSAVLRLRGLRAHRDDGRGGARSRAAPSRARSCSRSRITVGVYAVVAVTVLAVLGPEATAASTAPLADAAAASGWGWAAARRARRRGRGIPRRSARAHRRNRPHDARDGAGGRPAAVPRGRAPALARAAPRRARGRRRS